MYQIFIVTNIDFGEIDMLEYDDRDLANTVFKDFLRSGDPIITVNENKFRIWNAPFTHQPERLKADEWPQWAVDQWMIRRDDDGYLGAKLLDRDNIGCFELIHSTKIEGGLKKLERQFFTYKGKELFSVVEYD